MNYRANRPILFDRFIYIDASREIEGKNIGYWHIASIGEDESKFNMYPCTNDVACGLCQYLCDVDHNKNFLKAENSIPCLYRAHRVKWIKDIINMVNAKQPNENIRVWKKRNERTRENHLLLRYMKDHIDYIIIFKISYKNSDIHQYRLVTAFPVVLKSYKRRYDKEYEEYIKNK